MDWGNSRVSRANSQVAACSEAGRGRFHVTIWRAGDETARPERSGHQTLGDDDQLGALEGKQRCVCGVRTFGVCRVLYARRAAVAILDNFER